MNVPKRKKFYPNLKGIPNHDEFLHRITKTFYYTNFPTKNCLTCPVTELAAELFTEVKKDHTLQRLEIEEASRISRNACVSPCSMVLALLYIERLKDCNPEYLKQVTNSELFLVTLLVASKFLHDDGEEGEVFNADWASSGDLSVAEMNRLEKEFLQAINWSVFVKTEDFWNKLQELEKELAYKEAQKRGWFSYTELHSLLDFMQMLSTISYVINIYSICIAAYTAGLMTLVGSAFIASHIPGTALVSRQEIIKIGFPINNNTASDEYSILDNVTCQKCQILSNTKGNLSETGQNTELRLNSILSWLSKQSIIYGTNEHFESKGTSLVTRAKFNNNIMHKKNLAMKLNNKKNLEFSAKFLFYDWRYYLSTISKISFIQ